MKPQESAGVVVETFRLPSAITSYLENNEEEIEDDGQIIGGILSDTHHAWLSNGSKFVVINISTGSKVAAWTFGAMLRDFKARVTCVYELPISLLEQTKQLLIGLETELLGGMVCLFHCNGSQVLRAIRVDCQVICMHYVDNIPGTVFECFDGIVIIGTYGGGVFAVDLNKQSCVDAIVNLSRNYNENIKDELNIANLVILSVDDINVISQQRAIACSKDHHLAIQINEGCINNLKFILRNSDSSIKLSTNRENVFISSILYVTQIESLVIGFNIGAFQIWNLSTLKLEFTSQSYHNGQPVAHIGFLEPCDDPRAFCYLWIIQSALNKYDKGFPLAIMYSLTYQEKKNLDDYRCSYQNLLSCNLRFNLDLTNVDIANSLGKTFIGGRSLGCHTLTKPTNKEDGDEYVLNICQIIWECWTANTMTPLQSVMILFDIDQWYKEHMPEMSELQTNNFMSVVNIGDNISLSSNSYLCDVKIISDTLTSYVSVQRLEEHFYPNALGYEFFCLTNEDITRVLIMGVQRQLLASINEIGPSILLHPTKLFHKCVNAGLIPLYADCHPNFDASEIMQRQILLSIALEARLIQFLGKCACDWATGSHMSVGCTLQLLLDWSWNRAFTLKQNVDQLIIPFFNHSGDIPDKNSVQSLDSCVRQLSHISSLYAIIVDKCSFNMIPERIQEIKQRQNSVKIVAQYFQVIQWFLSVGLLPEFYIDEVPSSLYNEKLPYPVQSLTKFYQNRRLRLHYQRGENTNDDIQNEPSDFLFIDQFIKMEYSQDKLKMLWLDDQSSTKGLYPPPSLFSLLKIYLIPEIKEEHKHSLVLYTLIDYAMIFDNERYKSIIRRLMQFPTMFGLSSTAIKITQAFWHLDHKDFQLALNQLQSIVADCLTQWQHNVVLSALLVQKRTQSALQYLHVRKPCISLQNIESKRTDLYSDWNSCSDLYLSRGLTYEAFHLNKKLIKNLPVDHQENRLKIFFEGCRKMGMLSKILLLPLTQDEEKIFIQFLKAIDDTDTNDILVLYYLHRSRYIEAQQVNEELKRLAYKSNLPYDSISGFSKQKEYVYKTEARDQLVDSYCKTLPFITKQLVQLTNTNPTSSKTVIPTPITVNLQAVEHKLALYKSSFIQESIDKAGETWMKTPGVVRGLKRAFQIESTPFLCTPKLTKTVPRYSFEKRMSITPDESPSKRLRLDTINKSMSGNDVASNPKLKKEIDKLLHTPIVERRVHIGFQNSEGVCTPSTTTSYREATPQSILKIRKDRRRLLSSSIDERLLIETDDELETGSLCTQSDNLSRSIRFNIPSRNNSPGSSIGCTSDIHDSYSDLYSHNHTFKFTDQNKTVSSRRSIHSSDDLSECEVRNNMGTISKEYSNSPISLGSVTKQTFIERMELAEEHDDKISNISPNMRMSVESSFRNGDSFNKENNVDTENMESDSVSTKGISFEENNVRQSISISNETSGKGSTSFSTLPKDSPFLSRFCTELYNKRKVESFNNSILPSDVSEETICDISNNTILMKSIAALSKTTSQHIPLHEECVIDNTKTIETLIDKIDHDVDNHTSSNIHESTEPNHLSVFENKQTNDEADCVTVISVFENMQKNDEGANCGNDIIEIVKIQNTIDFQNNIQCDIVGNADEQSDNQELIIENYKDIIINNEELAVNTISEFKNDSIIDKEQSENKIEIQQLENKKDDTDKNESVVKLEEVVEVDKEKSANNIYIESTSQSAQSVNSENNIDDYNKYPDSNASTFGTVSRSKISTPVAEDEISNTENFETAIHVVENRECSIKTDDTIDSDFISEPDLVIDSKSVEKSSEESSPVYKRRIRKKSESSICSDNDTSKISTSRRSTRNSSKFDISIQSQGDSDQESTPSLRKSHRFALSLNKPNLSIIPEMSHNEGSKSQLEQSNIVTKEDSSQKYSDIDQYASTRRMTRHQKMLLEKSSENIIHLTTLEKSKVKEDKIDEENEEDSLSDDGTSQYSNFTERTLDPILLLDKKDFEGEPDLEECVTRNTSRASSVVSDFTDIETGKMKTPISESRTLDRQGSTSFHNTKNNYSVMIDSLNDSVTNSPGSRPRRLSFNRAVEALCTPKRRHEKNDSRKNDSNISIVKMDETLLVTPDESKIVNTSQQAADIIAEVKLEKIVKKKRTLSLHSSSTVKTEPEELATLDATNTQVKLKHDTDICTEPKDSSAIEGSLRKRKSSVCSNSSVKTENVDVTAPDVSMRQTRSSKPNSDTIKTDSKLVETPRKRRLSVHSNSAIKMEHKLPTIDENKIQNISPDIKKTSISNKKIRKKAASIHSIQTNTKESERLHARQSECDVKKKKIRKPKAPSIHGNAIVSNLDEAPIVTRSKISKQPLLLTPLSEEDRLSIINTTRTGFRTKIGVHKAVKPLEFVVEKK